MGIFYEAIEPYLKHHPKLLRELKPPVFVVRNPFIEKWIESKALELCFGLSAVAYLGCRRVLNLGDFSDFGWQRSLLTKPPKNLSGRKKVMISVVEARRTAINVLLGPEVRKEDVYQELTLCGLVGLGLLRIISPDKVDGAMERQCVIKVLMEKDPFAYALMRRFPDIFDGARTVEELIQDNNLQTLDPRQLQKTTS